MKQKKLSLSIVSLVMTATLLLAPASYLGGGQEPLRQVKKQHFQALLLQKVIRIYLIITLA